MKYVLYYYDVKHKVIRGVYTVIEDLEKCKKLSFAMGRKGKVVYYLPEDQFLKLKGAGAQLEEYNQYLKEQKNA